MKRRRIPYSAKELAFLSARKAMPRVTLHAAFVRTFNRTEVTYDHIKSLCLRNGWTTGRAKWTAADDTLLRELYPDTPTAQVAERIGHTLSSTYQRAKRLGLSKSEAYLASPAACRLRRGGNVGAAYRFTKGHTSHNKGKPMPFHPNSAATRFKKGARLGQAQHNWKPVGSTRVVDGYEYTKVSDLPNVLHSVNWKHTHVLRWVALNGPVPKGSCLKSLDGNPLNTDPSNWLAIPRAMLPLLSSRHRVAYDTAPDELKPTLLAIAKVQHASNTADGLTPTERMIQKRNRKAS